MSALRQKRSFLIAREIAGPYRMAKGQAGCLFGLKI